ncbi:L,D-transpeptidase [Pseudohoeflea suaedae]|uniref:L,D-transpeptidase n=1 Tax=Pseudohoeflea suaedae TaxID=877384 RepID=A0A4R5PNJ4_9HYPH|nr:L,D-transpeptidase [Pseudohoeflea suaedae]TDH38468.1 L,D-transpeptidase [Pseudohoeflea suaedae]
MKSLVSLALAGFVAAGAPAAVAGERYVQRPPVVLSPDLSAPWVMQLGGNAAPRGGVVYQQPQRVKRTQAAYQIRPTRRDGVVLPSQVRRPAPAAYAAPKPQAKQQATPQIDPRYLPQDVAYDSQEKPGTIIIDTNTRHLYFVLGNGKARRYGVGVGKPGFEWAGTHKITQKREWPSWTPPKEMIERVRLNEGRILPTHMEGGPANPLGARAMYLGSTLYRIHGTNQPWTIGQAVSSGCIRMRNEDVMDLYERAEVGAKVIVS